MNNKNLRLSEDEIASAQPVIDLATLAVMELHSNIESNSGKPLLIEDDGRKYVDLELIKVYTETFLMTNAEPEQMEKVITAFVVSDVLLRGGTTDLKTAQASLGL